MANAHLPADTPIFKLTVGEFVDLLTQYGLKPAPLTTPAPQPTEFIYGIEGLARMLGCSQVTAHRIKKSGKVPYTQVGRKIVFNQQAVLSALNKAK